MNTSDPAPRSPQQQQPVYQPPDFPPRGTTGPVGGLHVGGDNPKPVPAPTGPADEARKRWKLRQTGRSALFGAATAVLVIAVLVVILVLWLTGVFA